MYVYLTLKQNEKAKVALDKYIELEPKNRDVCDSKWNYYMLMKKYHYANESYMKANTMDHSYSRDKADMDWNLYEQAEGNKLPLISMYYCYF